MKRSRLFDRFWIGSPGVQGCGRYVLDELQGRLNAGFDRPTRVYMTLGELERTGSINGAMKEEIYQEIAVAYDSLEKGFSACNDPNLVFAAKEFEDETHTSVVPTAFCRAYRFLMRVM